MYVPFIDRNFELNYLTKSRGVVVIYGPRHVGKSRLVQELLNFIDKNEELYVYIDLSGCKDTQDILVRLIESIKNIQSLSSRIWNIVKNVLINIMSEVVDYIVKFNVSKVVEILLRKRKPEDILRDFYTELLKYIDKFRKIYFIVDEVQAIKFVPKFEVIEYDMVRRWCKASFNYNVLLVLTTSEGEYWLRLVEQYPEYLMFLPIHPLPYSSALKLCSILNVDFESCLFKCSALPGNIISFHLGQFSEDFLVRKYHSTLLSLSKKFNVDPVSLSSLISSWFWKKFNDLVKENRIDIAIYREAIREGIIWEANGVILPQTYQAYKTVEKFVRKDEEDIKENWLKYLKSLEDKEKQT